MSDCSPIVSRFKGSDSIYQRWKRSKCCFINDYREYSINQTIVFVTDPVSDFERTISFRRYLGGISGLTKMYTYPVMPVHPDAFGQSLIHDYFWTMGGEEMHFNHIADKKMVEMFVIFPLLRDKGDSILTGLGYNMNDYLTFRIGTYQLYIRNKNGLNQFTGIYKSETIPPIPEKETIYKENAFFPERIIGKEDSVEIIIHPSKEIKAPMNAFIILLDQAHPDNIAVHQQISGHGDIRISRLILKEIEKPWLIYRNWGKVEAIPSITISMKVKTSPQLNIPIH